MKHKKLLLSVAMGLFISNISFAGINTYTCPQKATIFKSLSTYSYGFLPPFPNDLYGRHGSETYGDNWEGYFEGATYSPTQYPVTCWYHHGDQITEAQVQHVAPDYLQTVVLGSKWQMNKNIGICQSEDSDDCPFQQIIQ